MAPMKDSGPYMTQPMGSILETVTVLGQLLRPEGYSKDIINSMATSMFVSNEHDRIGESASMHLVAIKKTLLYAIPVIATPDANTGIPLTSQVNTRAIQLYKNKAKEAALSSGDKFRLLGFAFSDRLINNLAHSIYPQKYYNQPLDKYKTGAIDLSKLKQLETIESSCGKLFILDKNDYENAKLFNQINAIIATKLIEEITYALFALPHVKKEKLPELSRIKQFNGKPFIDKLNKILERQIDKTYNMALYEALQMTTNWLLYDNISLRGFESAEVKKQMDYLGYVKQQNVKVNANLREVGYRRLLETRAEKICRDKYPYYFDYTDRRAIFVRFNRFAIDKLPHKEQQNVKLLLEKDLAAQEALLRNKCEHIKYIKSMKDDSMDAFKQIETYINYDALDSDGMYPCKLCAYPLICVHTVQLYEEYASIPEGVDNGDNIYWAKQKIINKFKLTNQQRTGEEDTEVSFTYYCKHCGGELGKTADVIQASIKTAAESNSYNALDPIDIAIFSGVSATIATNADPDVLTLTRKAATTLIYNEIKDEIMTYVRRASKREQENVEDMIRYLSHAYTLVSLISININKIKSTKSIVNGTTPSLKDELIASLKILQSVPMYKRIGITDEKIKSLLIEAYKYVNRAFASEAMVLKPKTAKDKLMLDIKCSPLTHYATFMNSRFEKRPADNVIDIMGVKIDSLYPKKSKDKHTVESHALFKKIYVPSAKPSSDKLKYILESYQSLVDLATIEPVNGKFVSVITKPPSDFVIKYQKDQLAYIRAKRLTPTRYLPVENSREHEFVLDAYQTAYCLGETVRPHRWTVSKTGDKLSYECKHCKLNIEKTSKSNNSKIEDKLDEQMLMEAFFELYTISCPIKDAHIFENDTCAQCGVTKSQISNMDAKYYAKHSATYIKHRDAITNDLIETAKDIMAYPNPLNKNNIPITKEEKADLVKLESIASNLGKLYSQKNLLNLAMDSNKVRDLDLVESYVRIFYSHYKFAMNVSMDTRSHPDAEYFALIKKLNMISKKADMPKLPEYPISSNADQLLYMLYTLIFDIVSKGSETAKSIVGYILNKMIDQDERHKEFNFAKLKAVVINDDESDEIQVVAQDDDEDDEQDIFGAFDMDADDIEDNIDGDID